MKIICVGKIKEKYFESAIEEYQKRLSKYQNIKIIEVIDKNYNDINKSLKEEAELILKHIKENDYIITLEIEGKSYNSLEFSKKLEQLQANYANIAFIIGGSNGLDDTIKKRSNLVISFSKMTFPHQLFRIILLEQLYRNYKIINHESYHK